MANTSKSAAAKPRKATLFDNFIWSTKGQLLFALLIWLVPLSIFWRIFSATDNGATRNICSRPLFNYAAVMTWLILPLLYLAVANFVALCTREDKSARYRVSVLLLVVMCI